MDQRAASPTRAGRIIGLRVVVALLSAAVLLATGIGYRFYSDLTGGISTSDVILGGQRAAPGTDVNILLVGVDSRTDAQGHPLSKQVLAELRSGAEEGVLNSDTVILLHVPADGRKATAISIPRDSYVDIPGYGKNKINAAYPMATMAAKEKLRNQGLDEATIERESRTAGRTELIKTVEKLTGVRIHHFAEVNLLGFYQLTQAIGGVEVCLKRPVKEFRSGANFRAGRQTISGGAALAFVRQRYGLPNSDFSRIRRQQVFLAAVAHKILSAGTLASPTKLQGLIETAKRSVVLDSGWDIFGFARQASNIAGGNLEFVTIPIAGEDSTEAGDVVLVKPDEVKRFVRERTGNAPDASREPSPPANAVPPEEITVDVRNGTGRSGLASKVAAELTELGYVRGKLDNIDEPSKSSVHYAPGDDAAAEQVAEVLGGIATKEDSNVSDGTVRVYLASDFSLSDIQSGDNNSDGSSGSSSSRGSSRSTSQTPAPPPEPPITADGVPCVD